MTPPDDLPDDLRSSILDRFGKVATDPDREERFPVGPESAKALGYDAAEVDALPPSLTESFCGVGNPFSLGEPELRQTVLDLGCGAGFDTLLAARRVGASGRAIGVDMTPGMVAKARRNAEALGTANAEFLLAGIERLPLPDKSVDLVISNGVFNLCPEKLAVLAEVVRVLKPGGRLQMADILLEPHVTPEQAASKGSWSD
uniref:methyltransferase domain-containing protein n=1 Tax=Tautonia marina TaxID=2653855 RepID=UPI001375BC85|nr:methyltransferase domain-containing protein [Tautonia marina]